MGVVEQGHVPIILMLIILALVTLVGMMAALLVLLFVSKLFSELRRMLGHRKSSLLIRGALKAQRGPPPREQSGVTSLDFSSHGGDKRRRRRRKR